MTLETLSSKSFEVPKPENSKFQTWGIKRIFSNGQHWSNMEQCLSGAAWYIVRDSHQLATIAKVVVNIIT